MTVHDIAALAGVSIGTVDRVLNKRGRVSAATRAKIEAIVEQYHFTANPVARQLRRNQPNRFCALIPRRDQGTGYWGQIIEGVERAAGEIKHMGVETEIVEFDSYDPAGFRRVSDAVFGGKPEGLIFAPVMQEYTRSFVERICAEKIPLVFVDNYMPGIAPLCAIGQDGFKGGYLAGRLFHLFAGEVSKPAAVLHARSGDYHIISRRDGFISYAKENGFPVTVLEYPDFGGGDVSAEEIKRLLGERGRFSGLFVTNSMTSRAAKAVKQLKINEPFTLVGYDLVHSNRTALLEGRINAIISQRPEEQGREALLTLFRSVVLEQTVEAKREMPMDVHIRESTLNEN